MDRATAFAESIVNGTIGRSFGELEFLTCKRHLDDLKKQGTNEFPFVWSADKANYMLDFAESLTIAEGEEERPLVLWDFQCFMFGSWNGWVHKDTGYRRFRTSYIQLARQNGKSLGNAVPSLFYGNFDGYKYPQLYATATKEAQARIVLKECIKFINADKELKEELFDIKDYKAEILCNLTNGVIKALGRDTKSIDGFRPYFASVDEYHLHKDSQMYKLLSDGTKKLKQCLVSVITTAGFDLNSPCKNLYDYCVNILKGVVDDETQFVYITQMDENDDIWNERNWEKANPLWTQETLVSLRADAIKAKEMQGEELRNFMTKSLNVWVQFADNQYMNIEKFKACASTKTLDDFRGHSCIAGLDLSSGGDLTSLALVFKYNVEGTTKYFVHSHSFIPKMKVDEHIKTDKAPYDIWIRSGLLTATETLGGVKTDYKYIISYLSKLIDEYEIDVEMICYDPHNASAFLYDLEELGIDSLSIVQSARNLNDATVDFKLEVEAGNVEWNENNKLLLWSVANASVVSNSFGEIKIDKDLIQKRIDPIDAIIDAWKVVMTTSDDINEITNEYLDMMGW